MTPQDRLEFERMKADLEQLKSVSSVSFIENMKRQLDITSLISDAIGRVKLNQLADVDTSGVTNGQVIKYNDSNETWENANDIDT